MAPSTDGDTKSPGLLKVVERAKQNPQARFNSLAHLIDEAALERAFRRIRKDAAVGVDGVTKEQYEQNLEEHLRGLHERLRTRRYRHQPIRRVHIPKGPGKTRPIGISSMEDKIVQGALREVLEAIYEQDFLECSYGSRPGRSAHDALRALDQQVMRGKTAWILEADMQAYFDSLVRSKLQQMLQERVADGSLLRLVGKCLHVGVLDGEEYSTPDEGTAQGSIISPLLGNVYLHYVLDLWFEREVKPTLRGQAWLIRYADDFVMGFEREEEARELLGKLKERMTEYGLTLHPEKTRLVAFERPREVKTDGPAPETFDFLGFTAYWRRTRRGRWVLGLKTRRAKLRKVLEAFNDWCRRHRQKSKQEQHATLSRKLLGLYNYFGVNGNLRSLSQMLKEVERLWLRWLRRRSQRGRRLTWERIKAYLKRFPLPPPRIAVQIWAGSS